MRDETLRVIRVLRAVLLDQIVRQLVAERDPPVRAGLDAALGGAHLRQVQLREVAQVAEQGAVAVEGDGRPGLVVEDVDRMRGEVEDGGGVDEDQGELGEGVAVGLQEAGRVWVSAGQEEFDAVAELADEGEVVARFAVAVGGRLFDAVGLGRREEGGGVEGSRGFDR